MIFDTEYFQKRPFTKEQIQMFLKNAKKDLDIAKKNKNSEVIFTFAYQALLKLGIAMIAKQGYKVKSRAGHHIQIIRSLAELLKNPDIEIYGESMRRKRNIDLYLGGSIVTQKEALEYLQFTGDMFKGIS